MFYPNGDAVNYIVMLFTCSVIGGTLQTLDGEAQELAFFAPDQLPASLNEIHRTYIVHAREYGLNCAGKADLSSTHQLIHRPVNSENVDADADVEIIATARFNFRFDFWK